MEEIKVGEYIRTREPYGEIFKVIGIGEKDVLVTDSYENNLMATDWVEKHSPNIIDVIEVGDIVEVFDVLHNDIIIVWHEEVLKALKEDIENGIQIKSIVTHESFNSIKYEVI